MSHPIALITGITGQDGSYLAEFLLGKGYEVHGVVRRVALEDPDHRMWRIRHLLKDIQLHMGSLESYPSIFRIVNNLKPAECYHLAAQSFVSYSFEDEFSTLNTNINGTHHILAAIKEASPSTRFYFAGSSEMFGKVREVPQKETTPFHPRSPYGISKVAGFDLTRNYREGYGLFAVSGILFNHESPRRGFEFVTRKITRGIFNLIHDNDYILELGNLDAKRDWGYAVDYVEAMWQMLQHSVADDFVVATGETHSVRDFINLAISSTDIELEWIGKADSEKAVDAQTGRTLIKVNPDYYRPAEVDLLIGDPSKAKLELGWKNKTSFNDLVRIMITEELNSLKTMA
ncbi:GDP-mannose 4,6-dehydratase [bacterium]|nr:GDP-mannose 4,6-dehydratase [bacterium]